MEDLQKAIVRELRFQTSLKRNKIGTFIVILSFFFVLLLLIVSLLFSLSFATDYVGTYKTILGILVGCVVVNVGILVHLKRSSRKPIPSKRVQKEGEFLLDRLIALREERKFDVCYIFLDRYRYVKTPEDVEVVISDLKNWLGYTSSGLPISN